MKQITSYVQHAYGSFYVYKSAKLSAVVLQANNWKTGVQLDRVFPTTKGNEPDFIVEAIHAGQEHIK